MVTACDLSQHHIDIIKSKPNAHMLEDTAVCNTLDLSRFENDSFDVVLCMGALYHLREDEDRKRAVTECVRVCKPDGIVALAYITKSGAVLANVNDDASNIGDLMRLVDNTHDAIFICAFPHEMEDIATECGLEKMHHVGVDVIDPISEKLINATDEDFQTYMEFHFKVCEDPGIYGVGLHALWIGRKTR